MAQKKRNKRVSYEET